MEAPAAAATGVTAVRDGLAPKRSGAEGAFGIEPILVHGKDQHRRRRRLTPDGPAVDERRQPFDDQRMIIDEMDPANKD